MSDCTAIEENICLEKGADYEEVEWITDNNDNAIDISGDTFRAEVREYAGGPLIASFTFAVFLDGTIYKYRRTMAQSMINSLTVSEAVWDQFREHAADSFSEKMFHGKVTIPANVTSPTV